jgi:5'-3' exonuclease
MSKSPKLLLIDANNLCFREFYSKKNLSYKGQSVDVIFGVFKSIISYHKKWPDHFRIFAWEGGYSRRLAESEAAVASGLIPSSYKQTRRDKVESDPDPEIESLFEQMDTLKSMLDKTKTLQVKVKGFEADDVVYSYSEWAAKHGGEAVIVSSDQDFYQCLKPGVSVYNAMKDDLWTAERLTMEFGFTPDLWVDKGAIEGEIGASKDNIFGVTGWGPVNACKYVAEFGNIDKILSELKSRQKLGKREEVFIKEEERLRLAKSLKRMDLVENLPMPRIKHQVNTESVKEMFLEWGLASILKEAWRLV